MKYLFLIFFFLSPSILKAATPDNEIPLYEGVKKNTQQLEADQKFIKEAISAAGGKAAAVDQIVAKGWDAIQKKDLKMAIRRLNQGYLLSSDDYRVYWGLAIAAAMSGDNERSERLFAKGLKYNQKDVRFLCDSGFGLQQAAIQQAQKKNIDPRPKLIEAKKLFEQAAKVDPKSALPHAKLAVIYFYQGDCPLVEKELSQAQALGGEGLDSRFVEDYKKHCHK